jgi:hypothetical protein
MVGGVVPLELSQDDDVVRILDELLSSARMASATAELSRA